MLCISSSVGAKGGNTSFGDVDGSGEVEGRVGFGGRLVKIADHEHER